MGHKLSRQRVLKVAAAHTDKQTTTNPPTPAVVTNPAARRRSQPLQKAEQQQFELALEQDIVESSASKLQQIVIKIQLANMKNGNGSEQQQQDEEEARSLAQQHQHQHQHHQQQQQVVVATGETAVVDTLNANEQIVNVTLGGVQGVGGGVVGGIVGASASGTLRATAGSSTEAPKTNERQFIVNNNNLAGNVASALAAVKTLQLHDVQLNDDANHDDNDDDDESEMATSASLLRRQRSSSSVEGVDYCEVLEPTQQQLQPVSNMLSTGAQRAQANSSSSGNSCCRSRNSKAMSLNASTSSGITSGAAGTASKRRCCKCKCRDALRGLRGMLEPSSSNSHNKDKKDASSSRSKSRAADRRSTPATLNASSSILPADAVRHRQRNSMAAIAEPSQLAIWTAAPAIGHGDVIIRISSQPTTQQQHIVMEQAPAPSAAAAACSCSSISNINNNNNKTPTAVVAMGHNIRLVTSTDASNVLPPLSIEQHTTTKPYGAGIVVHSQIDFMHCLVPDLERIINSSFYWGKMDRYEAERLLEGKPEGTFLLRDSAQEEFLFSVTFRKYGRSLHARIEQSGHKFSFDCHDPCVFTALTVTGLLEHYKDPSCVMFFEPCLTMPLHRRQTFSLQQLARATIVSNITYDGINQLELPGRLKSYLKEYHYKQKLRVKPCDAHTPAPYYANI